MTDTNHSSRRVIASLPLRRRRSVVLFTVLLLAFAGCELIGDGGNSSSQDNIYPMYVDDNGNEVNDFVEASSHDAGSATAPRAADAGAVDKADTLLGDHIPRGPAPVVHAFVDNNGDGICDYAQNGSATWHGPGVVDDNENGICDYWDEASSRHRRHEGMRFQDHNDNQINDYFEQPTHHGPAHDFLDENGDGICDRAQDGSPTWHGPNFVDEDGNGRPDHWQPGGRGHGGGHHGGQGGM